MKRRKLDSQIPQLILVKIDSSWWPCKVLRERTDGSFCVVFADGTVHSFELHNYQWKPYKKIKIQDGLNCQVWYRGKHDPEGWYDVTVNEQVGFNYWEVVYSNKTTEVLKFNPLEWRLRLEVETI